MAEALSKDVPTHLGLILDGNRRWAAAHGLPKLEGHRQGAETLKVILRDSFSKGIKYVSAYVFSTENWKRAAEEVSYLMGILVKFVAEDLDEIHKDNIKIVVLGSKQHVPKRVQKALDAAESRTSANTGGVLAFCFNYGGKQEIIDAVERIVKDGKKASEINEGLLDSYMYHPEVPAVDLIIRTSGEHRLSNFMLWRSSYAELLFTDVMWPDFTPKHLAKALKDYANRQRRYGS